MTTQNTAADTPTPKHDHTPTGLIAIPEGPARAMATGGGILTIISTFMAWTWTSAFPGDLTVYGYPGGLQVLVLIAGILTTLFGLAGYGIKGARTLAPGGADAALKYASLAAFTTTWYTIISISYQLGGLANLDPGGWVAAIATLASFTGALALPFVRPHTYAIDPEDTGSEQFKHRLRNGLVIFKGAFAAEAPPTPRKLPGYLEILVIIAALAVGLLVFTYGIGTEYDELFIGFLVTVAFSFAALTKAGLVARVSTYTARHRNVTLAGAFAAAAAFPFTQSDDQYATIGVYILIFATVALGLNIVVGLAGLLDLGYVAFLGVGAYAASMVSGSPSSPFDVHLPFWGAILVGAGASLIFGVLIGAPTLRLRGDYLAIVTLGFGEIFRLVAMNSDGTSGPDITNGSNGISSIPNLKILGFDLGAEHTILGFTIGRFANYFFLMLLITFVVVLVFRRSENSRIGRAWVAIREDETAALAMGINGFRVKLIAFALGATLAGLAGTVQAHVTYTVTPEQYQFANTVPPNSAFLLAAVVLGGMGTISGPLVGAALLYLIPSKLSFLGDYQLFAFGLALVLLMRFRPEGLIPNRRRQLEFHEADLAPGDTPPPTVLSKTGA
ncbi:branched-chain amino acid ABC transporter permease [Streptomyces longisporoflavus]|uniref:branched-chain amino acid ABC transporter permease n=1 Tax=Streptomyces longisporoflavus TaxID=28044 RepID=UPI00167CD321|nr:branched-chain amino acid ABC transporter permease [Streptomyces longisporoflavus]GGV50904.1 branched-chain amino acid ABC transporter permease [Streptomyces longisporoflavus]